MVKAKAIDLSKIILFYTLLGFLVLFALGAQAQQPQLLKQGTFNNQSQRISGGWAIVQQGNQTYLQLTNDFATSSAPDLKVFLSPNSARSVNGRNATQGALRVSRISSSGGQTFVLPQGVNINRFGSVVIHCEAYSKLWGAGDIR